MMLKFVTATPEAKTVSLNIVKTKQYNMYQHLQYARYNYYVQISCLNKFQGWLNIHQTQIADKVSCSKSTVREQSKEKLPSQCLHDDFEKKTAQSNLRSLLAQGLQQRSYCSGNACNNTNFLAKTLTVPQMVTSQIYCSISESNI